MGDALFAHFARRTQLPAHPHNSGGGEARDLGGSGGEVSAVTRELRSELVVLVRFWTRTVKHGGERSNLPLFKNNKNF